MAMKVRICDKCKNVVKEDEICPCLKKRIVNSGKLVSVFIVNKNTEILVFHMDIERIKNSSKNSLDEIKKIFDGMPILMLDKEIKMSVVSKKTVNKGRSVVKKGPLSTGTGTTCSVCGLPQYNCPSGVTCDNGHGGADPKEEENNV